MTTMTTQVTLSTAQRIRVARVEAGLSQKELAELAGIAQPNLSRYENGNSAPTGDTVDKIMTAIMAYAPDSITIHAVDGVLGVRGRTAGKLQLVDLTEEPEALDWHAEGFLARGYTTVLAGQSGAGKSNLTQTMGKALANGEDYACGFALPGTRQRVLFVDAENGKRNILDRAKNMLGLDEDSYPYFHVAESKGFDLRYDLDALDGILADARTEGTPYDVLVLDSLMTLWFGNANVADQVRDFLQALNVLAQRHAVSILVIHHTGKGGEFYGSFAIEANVSCALYEFVRVGEDGPKRTLRPSKVRIAAEPKPLTLFVTNHGIGTIPETDGE